MFKGRYETTVDAKGRTSMPARFREALTAGEDNTLVITTPIENCLRVYPLGGWREFEKKLSGLPTFDPKIVTIKRVFIAGAVECQVDGHGRILIPQTLREHAEITREVVWCGMVSYVELWNTALWREVLDAARRDTLKIGGDLADLGL